MTHLSSRRGRCHRPWGRPGCLCFRGGSCPCPFGTCQRSTEGSAQVGAGPEAAVRPGAGLRAGRFYALRRRSHQGAAPTLPPHLPPAPPWLLGSRPPASSWPLGCARRGHSLGLRHGRHLSPSRLCNATSWERPPASLSASHPVTSRARTPCFLHGTGRGGLHRSSAHLPAALLPWSRGRPHPG